MNSLTLLKNACLPALVVGLLSTAACKQGEGDACQVTSDCEDGLSCVAVTSTCEKPGSTAGTPDAAPSGPDATPVVVDAAVPDAMADADVTPDADLTPDANPS